MARAAKLRAPICYNISMKIIIGNFKAYIENANEAKKLFELYKKLAQSKKASFIIAPPNLYLRELAKSYRGRTLLFAAQSVAFAGACTGCNSPRQIKDSGADFVLLGHSEQREMGLQDEQIAEILPACIKEELFPILIVGEPKRGTDATHFKFVEAQLKAAFKNYPKNKALKFIVAYEPVWAVGASKPPKAQDIEMMMIYIRKTLVKLFGDKKGRSVPIIYGGSVNADNIRAILEIESVDGVLLGRASVNKDELLNIYDKL